MITQQLVHTYATMVTIYDVHVAKFIFGTCQAKLYMLYRLYTSGLYANTNIN